MSDSRVFLDIIKPRHAIPGGDTGLRVETERSVYRLVLL